jgi:hypothetical protein
MIISDNITITIRLSPGTVTLINRVLDVMDQSAIAAGLAKDVSQRTSDLKGALEGASQPKDPAP